MPGGLPRGVARGGMLKLRFDRYIKNEHRYGVELHFRGEKFQDAGERRGKKTKKKKEKQK